jgi:hypothetical protein
MGKLTEANAAIGGVLALPGQQTVGQARATRILYIHRLPGCAGCEVGLAGRRAMILDGDIQPNPHAVIFR